MNFVFQRATKKQSKARIALVGPSGSGKTWTGLLLATNLGERVAVIDTERGSASKYAHRFTFDVLELGPPYSPERYIQAIKAAENAGYDVLLIDSISHAWDQEGGVQEIVDNAAVRAKGNKFAAWREGTPLQNKFVNTMIGCKMHLIVTMRSRTEWVIEDIDGKKVPRKIGTQPVQRPQIEYEFDIVGDLDHEHTLVITKSRCEDLADAVIKRPGPALAETIKAWLSDGAPDTEREPSTQQEPPRNDHTNGHHGNGKASSGDGLATDNQRRMLFSLARKAELSDEQVRLLIESETGKASTKDLTKAEASDLIDFLKNATPEALQQALSLGPTDDVPSEEEYLREQEEAAREAMAAGRA